MKRVWFIFAWIYAVGIALSGVTIACLCFLDRSLEAMRVWYAVAFEGGLLLAPVVFFIAWIIAAVWALFSKTSSDGFTRGERSKPFFIFVGILFLLVIPFFLYRDARLESAARAGSVERARLWLALGANQEAALPWAVIYGQRDMVDFLLKKEGRLGTYGHWDTNNILNLVPNGHEDISDLLKQYGAQETGVRAGKDAIGCERTPEQHRYTSFTNQ